MPGHFDKKLAGLLIPTFALRGKADLGIGDTNQMRAAVDFCHEHRLGVLQILPINETGGDHSPYNAISSMALDPVLLSISADLIPGLSKHEFERIAPEALLLKLRSDAVDYSLVKQLKQDLLYAAYEGFWIKHLANVTPEAKSFEKFELDNRAWLSDYTLFRTLLNEQDGNVCWTNWEPALRTPTAARQWLASFPERERLSHRQRFYAFVQWLAFTQWKELKAYAESKQVALMGDIPFGVSRYSADVWAHQDLFDLEWSGGAPPEIGFINDLFLQRWGQNWGIPLYDWTAHRQQNFAWWRQRIQCLHEFFHYFRIDHVLGFFRIYSFPWLPERNGEFVNLSHEQAKELTGGRLPQFLPGPDESKELAQKNCAQGRELLQMILDASGDMGVVAEDLGVVPKYVRPLLTELGIPGFYIPIFERHEEDRSFKPKDEIPPLNLGTYATHDHQPLVKFYQDLVEQWHGPDGHEAWLEIQRLMRFLGWDEKHPPDTWTVELHDAFFKALLDSPCWLSMFMITDLLGSSQRFNEPGSSSDSNWSQRLDRPLELYDQDPYFGARLRKFKELVVTTGRAR